MKIKVLQEQKEFKGCPIAIRQIGDRFEFITCIDGMIYSSHIVAKKGLFQRLFLQDYTKKELKNITQYVMNLATTTIESVLEAKEEDKKNNLVKGNHHTSNDKS
ncbi:MAG: hypothetical protein WCQ65_10865 [Fermentimonas sp.]|jgi:hypothetical protein